MTDTLMTAGEIRDMEAKFKQAEGTTDYYRPLMRDRSRLIATALKAARVSEFSSDIEEILGRPNFACHPFAEALRADGRTIPPKAEVEQANVLHWFLLAFMEHGENWKEHIGKELERIAAEHKTLEGDGK